VEKWVPIAAGVGVGIVGILLYQKYAAAATPAAAPAVLPSAAPASATVSLQPGATTVSVMRGGSVILALPAGASWSTATTPVSPLQAGATQPTGNQSMNLTAAASPGITIMTANWVDSSGNAQITTINVAAS
jgi:hypothetical protein